MSRVALLGLPDDLAHSLTQVLHAEAHQVTRKIFLQDLEHGPKPQAVFISGDHTEFCKTITLLRQKDPKLPVVVVTRQPGAKHWLDALEAGATDYCGAPFERVQVRWMMESLALAERQTAA
jgi:CheY-like chemotaxis protein